MKYTVKQLANIAGITVRTLHYYDEIGLLIPSYTQNNGYRYYGEPELIKLQQILFYKELEFPLKDILQIIKAPDFNELEALIDQKKLLYMKKQKLERLLKTIDKTILTLKGGKHMNTHDLFDPFADEEMKKYQEEAKQRWGNTEAYKESMKKVKTWTKADFERIKKEGEAFTQELAKAMDKDIKSPEVQALIGKHHQGIEYFYKCPLEMYRNLGKMYVDDKRFTAYYDKFRPGLAQFVCDAIAYYCDVQKD